MVLDLPSPFQTQIYHLQTLEQVVRVRLVLLAGVNGCRAGRFSISPSRYSSSMNSRPVKGCFEGVADERCCTMISWSTSSGCVPRLFASAVSAAYSWSVKVTVIW